jgi:hypothetical protein
MGNRVTFRRMRAARRVCVRGAVLIGATGLSAWLGVSGCQFPEYDLARGGSGQTGAEAGASLGGTPTAGTAPEGGAGAAGEGGADNTPVACGAGLVCTAALPAGWLGPVAYWRDKAGDSADVPDCPDGYHDPIDLHTGLVAPDAECSCSCTPKGQACDKGANVSLSSDLGCANECFHATPLECTAVSGCTGSQGALQAAVPKPSGSCVAKVTSQPLGAVSWQYDARLCSLETAEPGSCTGPGELCTPTPSKGGYASQLCVYRVVSEGQNLPECPAAYPNAHEPLYESFTDERGCSSCVCSGLIGGACTGKLMLSSGASCSSEFEYILGTGCQKFTLSTSPAQLGAQYTLVPGTCGVARDTEPTGGAVPSGSATVVCCL